MESNLKIAIPIPVKFNSFEDLGESITPPLSRENPHLNLEESVIELDKNMDPNFGIQSIPYYHASFQILNRIFTECEDVDIKKYANNIIYKIIFFLERTPDPIMIQFSIEFAFSRSIYFVNPFWFSGIVNPISKLAPFNKILFGRPDFIRTIKTYREFFDDKGPVPSFAMSLYCGYLMNMPLVNDALVYFEDSKFFFLPMVEIILKNKNSMGEYVDKLVNTLIFMKSLRNSRIYGNFFREALSPLLDVVTRQNAILLRSL